MITGLDFLSRSEKSRLTLQDNVIMLVLGKC